MKYKEIVEALAKYHNSYVDVVSDEAYSDGNSIYRIISLKSDFLPYVGSDYSTVFFGTGCSGSEEDAYRHFLEDYVGKDKILRFIGGYQGSSHRVLIPANSVDELVLVMTVMGLV